KILSERPATRQHDSTTVVRELKSQPKSCQTCDLGDVTLMFPELGRLIQRARGLINGEIIVDGFSRVGNIFQDSAAHWASERVDSSSKTLSKSEAFTTPTILPPF